MTHGPAMKIGGIFSFLIIAKVLKSA